MSPELDVFELIPRPPRSVLGTALAPRGRLKTPASATARAPGKPVDNKPQSLVALVPPGRACAREPLPLHITQTAGADKGKVNISGRTSLQACRSSRFTFRSREFASAEEVNGLIDDSRVIHDKSVPARDGEKVRHSFQPGLLKRDFAVTFTVEQPRKWPSPDYARDLNSSEIWAQKKGRSPLI